MKKHHELTNLLYPFKVIEKPQQDSIIRKWLSEKSKAINADANAERTVDEILGLTDEPEQFNKPGFYKKNCMPKSDNQKQSWCEHITYRQYMGNTLVDNYRFLDKNGANYPAYDWLSCPRCGAPRPTPRPLVERVATVMWECSTKTTTFDNADQRVRGDWLKEAQAALDFLREHKEEL